MFFGLKIQKIFNPLVFFFMRWGGGGGGGRFFFFFFFFFFGGGRAKMRFATLTFFGWGGGGTAPPYPPPPYPLPAPMISRSQLLRFLPPPPKKKKKNSLRVEIVLSSIILTKYICRRIQYDVIANWLASLVVTPTELPMRCSRSSERKCDYRSYMHY